MRMSLFLLVFLDLLSSNVAINTIEFVGKDLDPKFPGLWDVISRRARAFIIMGIKYNKTECKLLIIRFRLLY